MLINKDPICMDTEISGMCLLCAAFAIKLVINKGFEDA